MKITKKRPSILKRSLLLLAATAAIFGAVYLYGLLTADQPQPSLQGQLTVPVADISPVAKPELAVVSEAPARLVIDKINVDAAIHSVGLTSDGLMDAPDTNDLVGWYDKSALAGEDEYAVLLDGHYGTATEPAVFRELFKLAIGDSIYLHGDKGAVLEYKVVETEQQYAADVDMKKALYPYSDGMQSLTIITCEGLYDAQAITYDKRTIVYAERVA